MYTSIYIHCHIHHCSDEFLGHTVYLTLNSVTFVSNCFKTDFGGLVLIQVFFVFFVYLLSFDCRLRTLLVSHDFFFYPFVDNNTKCEMDSNKVEIVFIYEFV